MDMRWCDNCGTKDYAAPKSKVMWYYLTDLGMESSLCRKCLLKLRMDDITCVPID